MSEPATHPGPPQAWVIAWTLQGVLVIALEFAPVPAGPIRLAFLAPLAGLPLLGLYLWLKRGQE